MDLHVLLPISIYFLFKLVSHDWLSCLIFWTMISINKTSWGERERVPPWEFNAPPVCQSVCLYIYIYIYIYISYVRHFWSRGPRATRKRKPAHLKFKGHMHACCITLYVANASRAITTLIERLHIYSSSLITSSAG